MQYLADTDTHCTNAMLQEAVLRYNAALFSFAPVEHLFSIAGLIEIPRTNGLSDRMFEKFTPLKQNGID